MDITEVKVLNLTFQICETDCVEFGSSKIGMIDHLGQVIYIQRNLSIERKKIVLIHEILHSMFEQLGFHKEHEDEHLINSVATAIYQVFSENKTIFL